MNSPDKTLPRTLCPKDHIRQKTQGEIEAYIASRGKTRVHEGAKNLSLNVSDDYGNRFLLELIQNAHDAHPPRRQDGEISIVLAQEEEGFGCLYVANRGIPFGPDNFDSITNIALSSKHVNEDIGNKGLGFRSVLQICHWPEIYSGASSSANECFDGYSFKFASEADVFEVASDLQHAELAAEIWKNMPCWFLPIFGSDRPGLTKRFAEQGFVTVVRMPLQSEGARAAVEQQLDALIGLETPLHLFLERVAVINIERSPGNITRLDRKVAKRWKTGVVDIQRVQISQDHYVVASMDVNKEEFRTKLRESLDKKQIPSSWGNWRGQARVSVAVRLNRSVERGLLYCFLPLGEAAEAPFSGYLNANFYTKMDRRSFDGSLALNRFFITSACLLCRQVIDFLIEQNWPESPGAVVDLLCWRAPYISAMHNACGTLGRPVTEQQLLPVLTSSAGFGWASAADTYIWDVEPEACMSPKVVAGAAGVSILWSTLSDVQRKAVSDFFAHAQMYFNPTAETIGNWVEAVAQQMHAEQATPDTWATFYDEIADRLSDEPEALRGRKFLLTSTGALLASELVEQGKRRRRHADIYLPPGAGLDDDDDDDPTRQRPLPLEHMPSSLRRGFAFLHNDLPWRQRDGNYRPSRAFLIGAKLVREYDTRDVLRTLAAITREDVADSTKVSALEWSFRLWSTGRALADKETTAANFALPTITGWASVEEVMFGAGWNTSNGKVLESFLRVAGQFSAELERARGNLLLPFKQWPIKYGEEADWIRFLHAAGVLDILRPIAGVKIEKTTTGAWLADIIVDVSALDKDSKSIWRSALKPLAADIRNPYTSYRCDFTPWSFPGQPDSLSFSAPSLRREYAHQILRATPYLERRHFDFRVYRPGRHGSQANEEQWPTPLHAFLTNASWLPVQQGNEDIRFVKPCDAWLASREFDSRPPRFVNLVSPALLRNADDGIDWLITNADLGVLDEAQYASRALKTYSQIAHGEGLSDLTDVKRFRELFGRAWESSIAERQTVTLSYIPIVVGDRISAMDISIVEENHDVAYLLDDDDEVKKEILRELGAPLFDFHAGNSESTWSVLNELAPGRFLRASELALEVHLDDVLVQPSSDTPFLREVLGESVSPAKAVKSYPVAER